MHCRAQIRLLLAKFAQNASVNGAVQVGVQPVAFDVRPLLDGSNFFWSETRHPDDAADEREFPLVVLYPVGKESSKRLGWRRPVDEPVRLEIAPPVMNPRVEYSKPDVNTALRELLLSSGRKYDEGVMLQLELPWRAEFGHHRYLLDAVQ